MLLEVYVENHELVPEQKNFYVKLLLVLFIINVLYSFYGLFLRNRKCKLYYFFWLKKLLTKFMEIKTNNLWLTQRQVAKEICFSDSTIRRFRIDMNMNTPKNKKKVIRRTLKHL